LTEGSTSYIIDNKEEVEIKDDDHSDEEVIIEDEDGDEVQAKKKSKKTTQAKKKPLTIKKASIANPKMKLPKQDVKVVTFKPGELTRGEINRKR